MASMNAAAVRAADSLLRGVGGTQVFLRTPAPANPDDDGEQLGLSTPQFQDSPLCPAVYRRVRPKFGTVAAVNTPIQYELLVSATAVESLIGIGPGAFASADTLFAVAFGVLIDAVLYEIVSATASEIGGAPYLYRLMLRAPLFLKT
jgi:hypothetical protein